MRRAQPRDTGFTLTELLVAMSLFSILLAVFMAGIVQMTKDTVRVQNVSDAADEARRAFDRFNRQIRYASAVNRPVEVGSDWYLEFQTTATGTATAQCTQWRLVHSTQQLQLRTWDDVTGATASAWVTIASRVANDPDAQQPFTFSPADLTNTRQRIGLFLTITNGQPGGAEVSGTFVARNTSTTTQTNAAADSGSGSADPVCQQVGRP